MPKPKSKQELLKLSQANFDSLFSLFNSFSAAEQERTFPEGYMNRNIRDVLAHLYHWHLLFSGWHTVGMQDNKPDMPAKGYTWKMTPELNLHIRDLYSSVPLQEIKDKLSHSHKQLQGIIKQHTEEELFEKKRYKWTGTTSLAAYLISATSSHYDWAYKLIKKCMK